MAYEITKDPVYTALQSLTEEQALNLALELDKLAAGYAGIIELANIQGVSTVNPDIKAKSYFYHTEKHALEMYSDAKYVKKFARKLLPVEISDAKVELYTKLVQCIHAVHDLVQGVTGPENNEIESFNRFKADFIKLAPTLRLIDMAELVIVDGTVFNFPAKASKGEVAFVNNAAQDVGRFQSALATFAMLSASTNDTARMTQLSSMLEDPQDKKALNKQYQSLKNNPVVQDLFNVLKENQPPIHQKETTSVLNMYKRSQSKNYSSSKNSFDGLQDKTIIPILSFMQLMGQNLRMIREMRADNVGFSTPYYDAIMLGRSTAGLAIINKDVEAAYDYVMQKMEAEVKPGGFSYGMGTKTTTIQSINDKFKETYSIDSVFDASNQHVWAAYADNATKVLQNIRQQENKSNGSIKFKKEILESFAQLAHNQTGNFMVPIPKHIVKQQVKNWQQKIDMGRKASPKP